jgi:CRISPR-associated endonuclease/helicase Cas3
MTRDSYHRFWAKTAAPETEGAPFHLLPYHNFDVAAVAQVLLTEDSLLQARFQRLLRMDEDGLISLVRTLVALHDAGKFSERFQALSPEVADRLGAPVTDKEYIVRHDTLGYGAWRDVLFPELWDKQQLGLRTHHGVRWDWDDYFEALARPIMGHHGSPPRPDEWQTASPQFSAQSRDAMIEFAWKTAGFLFSADPFEGWDYSHVERAKQASWMLAGLTVVADWIGSNSDYFQFQTRPTPLEAYWAEHALPQAKAAVSKAGLLPPSVSSETGLEALFPDFDPTPMQKYASEVPIVGGPMLFILEDVTGSGKTEAAATIAHRLMASGKSEGLYVGLPTMATANAMYERLAGAYRRLFAEPGKASLALAHSARDLSGPFQDSIGLEQTESRPHRPEGQEEPENGALTGEAQCAAWLSDRRKKALLAHVGVGTVDQALLGTLPSDHQSLRLLGLGRNALIVDEVHAYDPYMQRLLEGLLRFQAAFGGSAILLSATLPKAMRQSLVGAFCEGAGADSPTLSRGKFPLATRIAPKKSRVAGPLSGPETAVNEEKTCLDGAEIRQGYRRCVDVNLIYRKQDVIDRLAEEARKGRCACWIRNTVADARDGWEDVRKRFEETAGLDEDLAGLFHARYCLSDRQAIEDRVLRHFGKESGPGQRAGRVLIATQVVEQSLDLDFDYMITDLSPIDLIIQRAGREQRHLRDAKGRRLEAEEGNDLEGESGPEDRREGPELGVFGPPPVDDPEESWYTSYFPKAAYVYSHAGTLWRTARMLDKKGRIRVPKEARALIEGVYGEEAKPIPKPLREASEEVKEERKENRSIATSNVLRFDRGYGSSVDQKRWTSEQGAPTRLGEPTTTVRLGRVEDGKILPWADGENAWRESELRVRSSMIEAPPRRGRKRREAAYQVEETMPDGGRWSVLLVLEEEDGEWTGRARDDDGTPVEVQYSPVTGLHVSELSE